MYIYPSRVNDDLIRVIRDTPNVIPYIDMPIQHVSSDILKSMQRRHDKDFLLDVFEKFHKEIPNFALRTTFILGFPGESDAHVKEIQDFITEIPFAQVGCFAFSYEEGTRSARLPDQVPADLAQERIAAVMQSQKESLAKQVESMIDTEILVIYDGHGIARGMHQAPEVDTVTFIDKPDGLVAGEIYTARITGSRDYDLVAEVLK